MDADDKLRLLSESARFEMAGRHENGGGLFKVLMTNACDRCCAFCPASASRDAPRAAYSPNELAGTFRDLHAAKLATGLFLSSGVCGGADKTMETMLDAVHIVRERDGYDGYVHLKVMPGASDEAIRNAVTVANRVSVNMDVPNTERMACVEPARDWDAEVAGTLVRVRNIAQDVKTEGGKAADIATALVVGASGETDSEILNAMQRAYSEWDVRRVHFGRFQPVGGTDMESAPETPARRVQRLNETDWLIRRFGFQTAEFLTGENGNLDLNTDPKLAVALRNPDDYPIDVDTAPREKLLRVPGIGELSARRILRARSEGGVRDLADLAAMGVIVSRAAAFVTIRGRKTSAPPARSRRPATDVQQFSLF